jgi:HlyD family secretion protein
MKRIPRWSWVPVVVLIVAFVLARAAFAPRPIAVGVATVARGPVEQLVANSEAGSVRTRQTASIACDRPGRVMAILHREGETVRAGELLLQLDATTAGAALHASRHACDVAVASRQTALAAAQLADEQFTRAEELQRQALLSPEQFDEARSRRDAARSELRAAEARIEAADAAVRVQTNEIAHLELRAPFAGVLSRRLVEVGETVTAGQPAFELVALDRLYVTAPIDERDAGSLVPGQPVRVTLDAYPGVTWQARLTRVSPVAEEARQQNRTVEIEVDLPVLADHPQPRPGFTADVEIVLSRRDSVLRVPTPAVIDARRVLRFQGGKAVARDVKVGTKNWDWTEVAGGLEAGDRVITTLDRAGVKDGARVRLEPRAPDSKP